MGRARTVASDLLPANFSAEQIMGMPARALDRRWTEQEFYAARDAAPPGERWELVDGEVLVTPSPSWVHQHIVARLLELIAPYARVQKLGRTFTAPLDVKLEPGLVLQPDLLVVPAGELRRRSDVVRHLLLAVEIISPTSARHDRVRKRPAYQRNRVSEYWIVDEMSQTFERWTPDDERAELLSERIIWHPPGATESFQLDLIELFDEVASDEDQP